MPETGDPGNAQSPLTGVILCCTSIGIEEREQLGKWASDMGAAHKLDLTSDVTHLVVGNIETPKYKYVAKARPDVRVVTPGWIEAVRDAWMAGGEPDVEKLEEEHRVPTFLGMHICVTGFEDLEQREQLQNTINKNGATYHGDLTKTVTHLIARVPQGKKYEHAQVWGQKTVSLEWVNESIERGMALDEGFYHPTIPQEERGKGAWQRQLASGVTLGKRTRLPTKGEESGASRRKLRRTASTKLGSQSQSILAGIASGSFTPKQDEQDDSWPDEDRGTDAEGPASERKPTARRSELKKVQSMPNLHGTVTEPVTPGIWTRMLTHVAGFDAAKTAVLHQHLASNGAVVTKTVIEANRVLYDERPGFVIDAYLIVPHDMTKAQVEEFPEDLKDLTVVNEWWVEKCLFRKALVDPKNLVVCKPFKQFPIKGFEGMRICSTSFSNFDLQHLAKVVKLMGATYDQYLKPEITVLVGHSDSLNKEKLKFCAEQSIPVVNVAWLWHCIQSGIRHPFQPFLLQDPEEGTGAPGSVNPILQEDIAWHKAYSTVSAFDQYLERTHSAVYADQYDESRKAETSVAAYVELMQRRAGYTNSKLPEAQLVREWELAREPGPSQLGYVMRLHNRGIGVSTDLEPDQCSGASSPVEGDTGMESHRKTKSARQRAKSKAEVTEAPENDRELHTGSARAKSPPQHSELPHRETSGLRAGRRQPMSRAMPLTLSLSANPPEDEEPAEDKSTNTLALKPPPKAYIKPSMPFIEDSDSEDEPDAQPATEETSTLDFTAPLPTEQALQSLSQSHLNSPPKPSSSTSALPNPELPNPPTLNPSNHPEPAPTNTLPATEPTPASGGLETSIAALLAQKQSRATAAPAAAGHSYRSRRRQLGRAPSTTSNISADSSDRRGESANSAAGTGTAAAAADAAVAARIVEVLMPSHDTVTEEDAGERPHSAGAGFGDAPMPTQALVWGDGETEGARQRIIRQLGGQVEGAEGGTVEGVGRVRDVGEGVGARVGRRARRAGERERGF